MTLAEVYGTLNHLPRAWVGGSLAPERTVRIDREKLHHHPGTCFNASVTEYGGRVLMAYRHCPPDHGSRIYVCELTGPDYRPGKSVPLKLNHSEYSYSQEDPRLFIHRGKLHVSFTGASDFVSREAVPNVLYAELADSLDVANVWYPHYAQRGYREKNWGFFSHDDQLHAVYTIDPHVIYRIEGTRAFPAYGTPLSVKWNGLLRGGAAPVCVGNEYYSFFHGVHDQNGRKEKIYSIGVYTFAAYPPFRVRRLAMNPLVVGTFEDRPRGHYNATIFPCGAIRRGDRWIVSSGVHDVHIDIMEFDANKVESALGGSSVEAELETIEKLPGWCSRTKARKMMELIQAAKPDVVVEIGVFGGRSLLPQALALRDNGRGVIYGIDPYTTTAATEGTFTADPGGKAWWERAEMLATVRKACLNGIQDHGLWPWVKIIETQSDHVCSMFGTESIDILHIDGNHTPEVSLRDVHNYLPRVKRGGYVWMDDTDLASTADAIHELDKACALMIDHPREGGIAAWRLYRKNV